MVQPGYLLVHAVCGVVICHAKFLYNRQQTQRTAWKRVDTGEVLRSVFAFWSVPAWFITSSLHFQVICGYVRAT
jgi:hypothetical protein